MAEEGTRGVATVQKVGWHKNVASKFFRKGARQPAEMLSVVFCPLKLTNENFLQCSLFKTNKWHLLQAGIAKSSVFRAPTEESGKFREF